MSSSMNKETAEPSIQTFFAGRSVFITGATGFMGKVLVEKLLRSCPDVAEIFLLIRPKKGIDIVDRLNKILDNKLFDKLRTEQPFSFNKLIPIMGDTAIVDLGLLPDDKQTLINKVSVIFHVAANVKFDSSLKEAIFNNTRSTRDVCILASSMKNLAVLLHVSSTYTQVDKRVVDEILYPTDVDWRRAIEVVESVDEHILKILTSKYIGAMPNTYVFSKKLAEQVISDYSESLPCVLLRPSIVSSTIEEPVKGWIDNLNGPMALALGTGKGILHVMFIDSDIKNDYMPVDVAIKMIMISAWRRGLKTISEDKTIHVYNCSSYSLKFANTRSVIQESSKLFRKVPLEGIISLPYLTLTKNSLVYYILVLLLHIFPAICIDGITKLSGKRPMLLNLQRKVYVSNRALSYFVLHDWCFKNSRCLNLIDNLSDDNKRYFGSYFRNFDVLEYYKNTIIGLKVYLLNEDMNNLDAAKLHYKRMFWLHNIIKTMFIIFILWIVYCKNILSNISNVFV